MTNQCFENHRQKPEFLMPMQILRCRGKSILAPKNTDCFISDLKQNLDQELQEFFLFNQQPFL